MLRCFKYANTKDIEDCVFRKEDWHCFNCIYCREDESEKDFVPASEETVKKVNEFFKFTLKMLKK